LEAVTDGEFRRRFWQTDFLELLNGIEGYVPEEGYIFHGNEETEKYNVRNVGKVSFNPNHPHVKDFVLFNEIVDGRAVAKQTIPRPNQLFNVGNRNPETYPDIETFANDVSHTDRDAITDLNKDGVRDIHVD